MNRFRFAKAGLLGAALLLLPEAVPTARSLLAPAPWPLPAPLPLLGEALADTAAGEALKAGVFDPPRAAPDFSVQGSNGAALAMRDHRGKVVVLEFGFTSCPKICPTTLATLAKAQHQMTADGGEGFQLLYLTVDPEHDSVEQLERYLAHFDASFLGGTGSAEQMQSIRDGYGIAASKTAEGFSHSSFTYLIDRKGLLRALMPYGSSADDYVHDLRILQEQ